MSEETMPISLTVNGENVSPQRPRAPTSRRLSAHRIGPHGHTPWLRAWQLRGLLGKG